MPLLLANRDSKIGKKIFISLLAALVGCVSTGADKRFGGVHQTKLAKGLYYVQSDVINSLFSPKPEIGLIERSKLLCPSGFNRMSQHLSSHVLSSNSFLLPVAGAFIDISNQVKASSVTSIIRCNDAEISEQVALLITSGINPYANTTALDDAYTQGLQYYAEGNHEMAMQFFLEVADLDAYEIYTDAYFKMGVICELSTSKKCTEPAEKWYAKSGVDQSRYKRK